MMYRIGNRRVDSLCARMVYLTGFDFLETMMVAMCGNGTSSKHPA